MKILKFTILIKLINIKMNQRIIIINMVYFLLSIAMTVILALLYLNYKYESTCGQTINAIMSEREY